jgi:hypothetical protein
MYKNETRHQREGGGGVALPELVPVLGWNAIIDRQSIGGGPPGPIPIPLIIPGGTPFISRF